MSHLHNEETAVISFSDSFGTFDYKLIEVPENIFTLVEKGESLKIVGSSSQDALLCSKDITYSIKRIESSNNAYFVPKTTNSNLYVLQSLCNEYYELKPIQAKFDKLDAILSLTKFDSVQEEDNNPINEQLLMTKKQLYDVIAASEKEIDEYLKTKGVIEYNGKVRMIARKTLLEVCIVLFNTIICEDWSISNVNETECQNALPEVDNIVLNHTLNNLGTRNDSGCWQLSQRLVLIESAHIVFHKYRENAKTGKTQPTPQSAAVSDETDAILINAEDFLREWMITTPGLQVTDPADMKQFETLLQGVALRCFQDGVKGTSSGSSSLTFSGYRYFPISNLSSDVKTRFSQLFEAKSRYMLDELEPYLFGLFGGVGQPKSMAELLLSHTRCVDNYYILRM